MITKIKTEFSEPDNKKLASNFLYLLALQVASFLLPLIVLPYLIIVLGIEKFGLVLLAQALMSYFIVLTDYGFNLTATRDISLHRNNPKKMSSILNSVYSTKLTLGIISFILFTIILFCVPKFSKDWLLYYFSFSMVLGQLLFPIWFFQGIEQMRYITYLTLLAKLIFTVLVFVVIKVPSDFIYVNVLLGMGNIISSVISIYFIKKKYKIKFSFSNISRIKFELKNGWYILLSSFSINVYINSNIIILGFFTNPIVLGYYSIAEKIMLAIRQILSVFSQVIYPHICKLVKSGHKNLTYFYKKIYFPFAIFIFGCCVLLFIFANNIVIFITGNNIEHISTLVRVLSFVPFIVCLNIPAYQTLLAYNLKKDYSFILTICSLLSIGLCIVFSSSLSAIGTVISILITEIIITIGLHLILQFKHQQYSLLKN